MSEIGFDARGIEIARKLVAMVPHTPDSVWAYLAGALDEIERLAKDNHVLEGVARNLETSVALLSRARDDLSACISEHRTLLGAACPGGEMPFGMDSREVIRTLVEHSKRLREERARSTGLEARLDDVCEACQERCPHKPAPAEDA